MTFLLILLAGVVALIVANLRLLSHDAPMSRPLSHHVDTDFVPPAQRADFGRIS